MSRDSDYDYDDGRRDHRRISKDEAEEILDEAHCKDFWAVDYPYDNRERLQSAIDRIYNTIPGNKYEVDYMNNQNGSRLIIRCVTCGKELTSFDPFITHEKGKPHKKVRQQQLNPKDPNLKGGLKRQDHNRIKGIFPRKSLEEKVDFSEDPVLGMQFVYKEEIDGKPRFTCQLCQKQERVTRIKTKEMFKHVKSKSHLRKYMDVKFTDMKTPFSKLLDVVDDVEKFEGKIHVPVVDFTKQMLAQKIKKEGFIKQEYPIKQEFSIKQERHGLKIKRERSTSSSDSSDSSPHSSSRRKKTRKTCWSDKSSDDNRERSPPLFRVKEEPKSPTSSIVAYPPSPEMWAPPAPVPPPRPALVDKGTMTEGSHGRKTLTDLVEDAKVLQSEEVHDQLLESREMQNTLIETMVILNKELYSYFKEENTICWNEKGHVVSKASESALRLEKNHLSGLEPVSRTIKTEQ